MAIEVTAQDRMTTEFTRLSAEAALGAALSHLQRAAYPYGVIMDAVGTPQGLVIAEDLERALGRAGEGGADLTLAVARRWLPPLLVVTREARLSALVEAHQMTLLRHGARGMVVTEDHRAVGVLTRESIARYLAGEHRPPDKTMGFTLPGPHETAAGTVICARCNTPNEVEFLDPDNPPWCVNRQEPEPGPHRLELGWL